MTQTLECSVLFADLRGSTGLYETLGNSLATQWVTRTVAVLAEVVQGCDGRVVKTLGDGLMAIFTSRTSAVQASIHMHDAIGRHGADEWIGAVQASRVLRLQVGLAHGEVVELGGDFFGDAVNVAARLLEHSGDNETLATSAVLDGLSEIDRAQFRRLERLQLRGRAEPVEVHVIETRQTVDMVATAFGDMLAAPEPEGVRLTWLDSSRFFATSSMPVVLGRSPQATYCIDDNRVSRSHARIDWHGGAFQLTDLSYNGSYVRYAADREAVSLRRGTCTLHGSGVIGLGTSPLDPTAPCVHFEVLRL